MSNPLFENPKVALGFSGVVLAVALVASVAFQELSSDEEAPQAAVVEQQAPAQQPAAPQPAQAGFASNAGAGWGEPTGVSDDWGAPMASGQGGGFSEIPEQTNDAPVFGDHRSQKMDGGGMDRSSGPKISSSAAPGAPEVRPPQSGNTPEIQVKGN